MEGVTFLKESIQKAFGRFVEVRLHQDHGDKEIAARNKELQRERFGTLALPYYALLDSTGETVYWTGAGLMSEQEFLAGLNQVP